MADIFVSYAREDRETVHHLAGLLERCGWTVWWDRHILAGKEFDNVLQEQIDAARCVLVVWSSASVASRWVKAEAGEGLRREILIPIRLEGSLPPLGFRNIQTVLFTTLPVDRESPAFGELMEALTGLLGGPSPPPPRRTDILDASQDTTPPTAAEPPAQTLATPVFARRRRRVALVIAAVVAMATLGIAAYIRFGRPSVPPRRAQDNRSAPTASRQDPKLEPRPQAAPSLPPTASTDPLAPEDKTRATSPQVPPVDAVPDKAIHDFVEALLVASSGGDQNRLLPFYGDRVDYFKMGVVDPDAVLKDRELYYRRWPDIKLRLDGDITVSAGETPLTKVVTYSCRYEVSSPARKTHASGVTKATLVLSTAGGGLKIIGQREEVKPVKR
jgi:hypothetical protein